MFIYVYGSLYMYRIVVNVLALTDRQPMKIQKELLIPAKVLVSDRLKSRGKCFDILTKIPWKCNK